MRLTTVRQLLFLLVAVLSIPAIVRAQSATPAESTGESTAESSATKTSEPTVDDDFELMKVFAETFEQIDRNYVKDVNRRELLEAAIQGMLTKLDQYSSYIGPEDVKGFNQSVDPEFGGIGIQVHVNPQDRRLTVMTPLPGTPAYKSGVRAGDVIEEIEGKSTDGFTIRQAVELLKGPAGEAVTIGVRHLDSSKIEQISITRDIIQVATVLGDHYGDNDEWDFMLDREHKIGYIRLTHFARRTSDELQVALRSLVADDMKGLVLDLRFNPGGLLSQAIDVADMFVGSGKKIVSTAGRANTKPRTWTGSRQGTFGDFPVAILVNQYSASASEIVSACLQDHKRAVVVGERTWGKGSVQNVINLEEGASALKLTTATYHRPSGKNIHRFEGAKEDDEWGVMPDESFAVPYTNELWRQYREYRFERDVLRKGGPPESTFTDAQLEKAVEYLLAKSNQSTSETATADGKQAEKPASDKPDGAKSDGAKSDGAKPDSKPAADKSAEDGQALRLPRRQPTLTILFGTA